MKTFILAPQWTSFQRLTFVTKTLKRGLLDISYFKVEKKLKYVILVIKDEF